MKEINFFEYAESFATILKIPEETIVCYKQVCQNVHKKLTEGLQVYKSPFQSAQIHFGQLHTLKIYTSFSIFVVSQGCGKGTDGGAVERRLKKSNDFTLGQVSSEF